MTSPVINTGVSGTLIVDEDNAGSNSDTKNTPWSVNSYVDNELNNVIPDTLDGQEGPTFTMVTLTGSQWNYFCNSKFNNDSSFNYCYCSHLSEPLLIVFQPVVLDPSNILFQ